MFYNIDLPPSYDCNTVETYLSAKFYALHLQTLETTKLLMRTRNQSKLELINEQECTLLQERWPSPECQRAMELFLANENNCGL